MAQTNPAMAQQLLRLDQHLPGTIGAAAPER